LEGVRQVMAQYPTSVPQTVTVQNALDSTLMAKYIETPMLALMAAVTATVLDNMLTSKITIVLSGCLLIAIIIFCWRLVWEPYLAEQNAKICRTKGLLNLIPMRLVKKNELLRNEFISGKLEK
jgi:hypothetical protein